MNIYAYANEPVCIVSYYIKNQCLCLYFIPHSLIYIECRLRYDQFVRCTILVQYITLGCRGNVDISSSLYGLFYSFGPTEQFGIPANKSCP